MERGEMMMNEVPDEKKPLTPAPRGRIWIEEVQRRINSVAGSDDKEPWRVIEEDYGGNSEKYLRAMAGWHSVPLVDGEFTVKTLNDLQKIRCCNICHGEMELIHEHFLDSVTGSVIGSLYLLRCTPCSKMFYVEYYSPSAFDDYLKMYLPS